MFIELLNVMLLKHFPHCSFSAAFPIHTVNIKIQSYCVANVNNTEAPTKCGRP